MSVLLGTLGDPGAWGWSRCGRSIRDPLSGEGFGLGKARPYVLSGRSGGPGHHGRRACRAGGNGLMKNKGSWAASEPTDSRMLTLEHFLASSPHSGIMGFHVPAKTFHDP